CGAVHFAGRRSVARCVHAQTTHDGCSSDSKTPTSFKVGAKITVPNVSNRRSFKTMLAQRPECDPALLAGASFRTVECGDSHESRARRATRQASPFPPPPRP